jgi:hypothetical protein
LIIFIFIFLNKNTSWRPNVSKWLMIHTHANDNGDIWFSEDMFGNPFSCSLEEVSIKRVV